jgi:hypothetical protein
MPRPACRTLLEGHVPADESKRLLTEQPEFRGGVTVPRMPHGSPGMEQGAKIPTR